jgi:DNA polymerase-3 subunit delta'
MPLSALFGHRGVYDRLLAELSSRPSHAYLMSGPRGIGKSLVVSALIHGLVCERSPGAGFCCTPERCPTRASATASERARAKAARETCGCCPGCVQLATGVHPDVIQVRRAEDRSDVLIEQVRAMIAQLGLRPTRAPMRLAMLDDAETLNVPAQNALLKTLEEPPGHALIFVITASEQALLDTVRSRLRLVRFRALGVEEIEQLLISRGVETARAQALARLARGSAARALSMVEGEEPPFHALVAALRQARTLDFTRAQALAQEFFASRAQAAETFELIARLFEEMLCYKLLGSGFTGSSPEMAAQIAELADIFQMDELLASMEAAVKAHAAVEGMANPRLQAEQLWMAVAQAARSE